MGTSGVVTLTWNDGPIVSQVATSGQVINIDLLGTLPPGNGELRVAASHEATGPLADAEADFVFSFQRVPEPDRSLLAGLALLTVALLRHRLG